jgi:DNA invertase Pin-like site-specific DNA recombinase
VKSLRTSSALGQSLDPQVDALTSAGVDAARVYSDKLSGTSTREQRPGLVSLLDYAREGEAIVVVGIDRLGRMPQRSWRRFVNLASEASCCGPFARASTHPTRWAAWLLRALASLAELELELRRERRAASREARRSRGHSIGRPKALDASKSALPQRMPAAGESANTIAATLGVSRAMLYRVLAD